MRSLSDSTSQKISLLRFPLIAGVVFIHNYKFTIDDHGWTGALANFIRSFVSNGIARISVPMFFLISGYLFFQSYTPCAFSKKLNRRIQSILIPLMLWNWIAILLNVLCSLVTRTASPIGRYLEGSMGVAHLIKDTLLVPADYPLWFLRDLMILVLIAPVIRIAMKSRRAVCIVVFLALPWIAFGHASASGDSIGVRDLEGLLFFMIGALLALQDIDIDALESYAPYLSIIALLAFFSLPLMAFERASWLPHCILAMAKIAAIPSIWWIAGRIKSTQLRETLSSLGASSFFVYVAHALLLRIVREAFFVFCSQKSGLEIMAAYLLIPILVMGMLVGIHKALSVSCPRTLRVLEGAR